MRSLDLTSADEASRRLGISRASLYAYVSRGLIRSFSSPHDPRQRLYAAEDVEALVKRRVRFRRPTAAAASALDWGLPVLETRITQIRDGRLFYRGRDALQLAETATFEQAAALLVGDLAPESFAGAAPAEALTEAPAVGPKAFVARAIRLLSDAPDSADTNAEIVAILRLMAAAGSGSVPGAVPFHRHLAEAWAATSFPSPLVGEGQGGGCSAILSEHTAKTPLSSSLPQGGRGPVAPSSQPRSFPLASAADAIRQALVLCADHELSASAFAVRVAASTGASLAHAVIAGLAALSGPRHGGATERVRALLEDSEAPGGRERLAALLQGEDPPPGFHHPLYPDGDPRGAALIAGLPLKAADEEILHAVAAAGGDPSIDVALVLLERAYGLPRGAAFALFAIGRTAGWLAHAVEQRAQGSLIRPRARYVIDEETSRP